MGTNGILLIIQLEYKISSNIFVLLICFMYNNILLVSNPLAIRLLLELKGNGLVGLSVPTFG
jgi:hypothetical protein